MISVSCVTSPGHRWLVIGHSNTIQPCHWLSPADGDILSERHDWCHREGKLSSPIWWSRDLLTWWRHHRCTGVQCVQGLLYSAGQWTGVKQCSRVLPHSQLSDQTALESGRLLSTCQDPDCPVSLRPESRASSWLPVIQEQRIALKSSWHLVANCT